MKRSWLCLKSLAANFTYSSSELSDLLEVNWLQTIAVDNVSWMILAIQGWGIREIKGTSESMRKGTTLFERHRGRSWNLLSQKQSTLQLCKIRNISDFQLFFFPRLHRISWTKLVPLINLRAHALLLNCLSQWTTVTHSHSFSRASQCAVFILFPLCFYFK